MSREEVIRLAEEAGLLTTTGGYQVWMPDNLERFVALVATAEREACAQVVENLHCGIQIQYGMPKIQDICAAAIRARGLE